MKIERKTERKCLFWQPEQPNSLVYVSESIVLLLLNVADSLSSFEQLRSTDILEVKAAQRTAF